MSLVTNQPLNQADRRRDDEGDDEGKRRAAGTPWLKSVHIITGAKPNSEPTERSNSPAVISSVIASAMRPSSTVKVSVLEMLRIDRKSGLIE